MSLSDAERRLWSAQARRAARMSGGLERSFLEVVQTLDGVLGREATEAEIAEALLSYPWDGEWRDRLLQSWRETQGEILVAAGTAGAAEVERLGMSYSFDLTNPYSEPWLRDHSARRVRDVTTETYEALRQQLGESFRLKEPVEVRARRMRSIVGLDRRAARAIAAKRARLEAQGRKPAAVDKAIATAHRKALNRRARLIARTEAIEAHSQGTLDSWRDAQRTGAIPPGWRKKWISGLQMPPTCRICGPVAGGLSGQMVPIDEPFVAANARRNTRPMRPPQHPACRCALGLAPPKAST